jgi:hypothetical protein
LDIKVFEITAISAADVNKNTTDHTSSPRAQEWKK